MSRHEKEVKETLAGLERLYSESVRTHGIASKSVCWKDEHSQRLRFKKLVEVIDPSGGEVSVTVNDYGCGYGALFPYLDALPLVRLTRYYGYDISEEMVATATEFVDDSRAEFILESQVTKEADYSFVSGTFNVKLGADDALWEQHIKDALMILGERSLKGFAFNLPTTYVDWRSETLFYAEPWSFFDFCKRNISPYVSILHDYPLFEWTMIVRKEPRHGEVG